MAPQGTIVSNRILVLAALERELAPLRLGLRGHPVELVRTGVGPASAAEATRRCVAGGPALVINTGCCGGLAPGLGAGDLVIADRVLLAGIGGASEAPPPDARLVAAARRCATEMGLGWSSGPLITSARALKTPESKRDCHARTGSAAVDMETAAVAGAAAEVGAPYLSLRVVLDPAGESLAGVTLREAREALRRGRLEPAALRPSNLAGSLRFTLRLWRMSAGLAALLRRLLLVNQREGTDL